MIHLEEYLDELERGLEYSIEFKLDDFVGLLDIKLAILELAY